MTPAVLRLAPTAHAFVRDRRHVQFGLDARSAGIAEVPRPAAAVTAVLALHEPHSPAEAVERLAAAGLAEPAAAALVDDMLARGLVVPVPRRRPTVVVLGRGNLAEATAGLLAAAGAQVRRPLRGESDTAYLAAAPAAPHVPVLAVDRLAHARALAPALIREAPTFLPVALVDDRGWVGPAHVDGEGPCPLCVDLHRAEHDPRWVQVVAQFPTGPPRPDAVLAAATAAHAARAALALTGAPAPGATDAGVHAHGAAGAGVGNREAAHVAGTAPGEVAQVRAGLAPETALWPRHRRCPVCWAVSSGRIRRSRSAGLPRSAAP